MANFLSEQETDKKNFRDAATNIEMKVRELISAVNKLVTEGKTGAWRETAGDVVVKILKPRLMVFSTVYRVL